MLIDAICSEHREKVLTGFVKLIHDMFECPVENPEGECWIISASIKIFIEMVDSQAEMICDHPNTNLRHSENFLEQTDKYFLDKSHVIRPMKRQYDLLNMLHLVRNTACNPSVFEELVTSLLEEWNFNFYDNVDEYLFHFMSNIGSKVTCCIMKLAVAENI